MSEDVSVSVHLNIKPGEKKEIGSLWTIIYKIRPDWPGLQGAPSQARVIITVTLLPPTKQDFNPDRQLGDLRWFQPRPSYISSTHSYRITVNSLKIMLQIHIPPS